MPIRATAAEWSPSLVATCLQRRLEKLIATDPCTSYLAENEPRMVTTRMEVAYKPRVVHMKMLQIVTREFPVCEYGAFFKLSDMGGLLSFSALQDTARVMFRGIKDTNTALWSRGGGVLFREPRVIINTLPGTPIVTVAWKTFGFPASHCYVPSPEFGTDQI